MGKVRHLLACSRCAGRRCSYLQAVELLGEHQHSVKELKKEEKKEVDLHSQRRGVQADTTFCGWCSGQQAPRSLGTR